ncbi:Cytochrome P450 86A8 [Hondaea fermentalgiana]|uniref:Cytochrome P450 86A8 n=1 Tax=Hondaea fermentalgiana TaxID=2315210 RepID=A0A2R5G4Q3_9STRA|nr:Cytochrome P450 86A8 [Hondaea fermentalgiana]|eukprot:GBG24768.1 Cytochrome P450 86A8 [Hondaea fermentalgiana]
MGQILTALRPAKGALLVRVLKAYLVFAVAHMMAKTARFLLAQRKFKRATKHIPGGETDWTGKNLVANVNRFQEHSRDLVAPHIDSHLVKWEIPGFEIVFNSPEAVKFMLKDRFDVSTKPDPGEDELFVLLTRFIGASIFTLRHGEMNSEEHDRWYRQRKAAALIFTKSKFSNMMFDVFVRKAQSMIDVLTQVAKRNAAAGNPTDKNKGAEPVEMQEKFFAFTFDSIQQIFFGDDVDTVSGRDSDAAAVAFDGAHRAMTRYHLTTVPHISLLQCMPFPIGPLWYNMNWTSLGIRAFKAIHPLHQTFESHVEDLHRITREKIQRLRRDPKLAQRDDLIANFINHDASFRKSKRSGPTAGNGPSAEAIGWTDDELLAIVLNFIIAGRDTSACTLTWLFYELAINPEIQANLQRELDENLEGRTPTYEEVVHGLPYLNGCLFEALRLHPPVPQDVKVASKDMEFIDGTLLPAGVRMLYLPYVMGRDENRYSDALSFKPERWIPFTEPDPFAFPVFQAAYRSCLGRDMAKFEVKLLTAMLLQKLSFRLEANEDPNVICPSLAITMSLCNSPDQSTHELWLVPQLREDI